LIIYLESKSLLISGGLPNLPLRSGKDLAVSFSIRIEKFLLAQKALPCGLAVSVRTSILRLAGVTCYHWSILQKTGVSGLSSPKNIGAIKWPVISWSKFSIFIKLCQYFV